MQRLLWGVVAFVVLVAAATAAAQFEFAEAQTPSNLTTSPAAQTTSTAPIISTETDYVSSLQDYGPAPELANESWLNVDHPLRLADLRGKVVLLDMWTFECINCIHIIPSLRDWYQKYSDQGLVIIGNHFPEFSFEHDIVNLRAAMQQLNVAYAVTQDNDGATWNAYGNRYWPTVYLIDKKGHIRYLHIGEGAYDTTEQAIQDLLKEDYTAPSTVPTAEPMTSLASTADLDVHSGADATSSVIGKIQTGESFVVRGQQDGWYRIQYDDGEGFVPAQSVTVTTS